MTDVKGDSSTDEAAAHEGGWYSNEAATFGDRVVAGRQAAGQTQAALARRLGVKLRTLQNWENDLSEPRANKLQMLAGVLNVSLMWLLTGEGDGVDEPPNEGFHSPELADIRTELAKMRLEALAAARRIGLLEKRLRQVIQQKAL